MSMFLQLVNSSQQSSQDLTQWFGKIQHLPYAMLLDSASTNHPNSRYDILVADPYLSLEANDDDCMVTDYRQQTKQTFKEPPLILLKRLQQQYCPKFSTPSLDLPFVGGVLGYFGYDLGRTLEKIPNQAIKEVMVPDLAVGFYDWALVLDKSNQQLWYIDQQGDAEKSWQKRLAWFEQQASNSEAEQPFSLVKDWQANMSKAEYLTKFAKVQQYLQSGDCYQINLAQRFAAPYSGSEWQAYLQLRQHNAAPFSAFIRLAQCSVLSISPERFLEVKNRQIETKPIKGTKPRFDAPELDQASAAALQTSEKDRAENVMIVDLLRNDLGKVCRPGSVKVPELFAIESFPAVHHLVSTVTGELAEQYQVIDALAAAFPGGSITGAPKIRAMQIIEELEPHRRHLYCGAIGYLSDHGHMDTNIAIRTLVCAKQTIYAWAGGGIVADSIADNEYQETFDKVAKILPILGKGTDV